MDDGFKIKSFDEEEKNQTSQQTTGKSEITSTNSNNSSGSDKNPPNGFANVMGIIFIIIGAILGFAFFIALAEDDFSPFIMLGSSIFCLAIAAGLLSLATIIDQLETLTSELIQVKGNTKK